jgi:hypothetical protein
VGTVGSGKLLIKSIVDFLGFPDRGMTIKHSCTSGIESQPGSKHRSIRFDTADSRFAER